MFYIMEIDEFGTRTHMHWEGFQTRSKAWAYAEKHFMNPWQNFNLIVV